MRHLKPLNVKKCEVIIMVNLVEFGRIFLSYGLLLLIIVAVCAVAVFIGITLAKKKNAKKAAAAEAENVKDNV